MAGFLFDVASGLVLFVADLFHPVDRFAVELFLDGAGADSILARLSRSGFEAGLEAMRSHAALSGCQAVFEPIDVLTFR